MFNFQNYKFLGKRSKYKLYTKFNFNFYNSLRNSFHKTFPILDNCWPFSVIKCISTIVEDTQIEKIFNQWRLKHVTTEMGQNHNNEFVYRNPTRTDRKEMHCYKWQFHVTNTCKALFRLILYWINIFYFV